MLYTSTDFGVDSSNRFPLTARKDRHTYRDEVTDATDRPTHAAKSITAGVGNEAGKRNPLMHEVAKMVT